MAITNIAVAIVVLTLAAGSIVEGFVPSSTAPDFRGGLQMTVEAPPAQLPRAKLEAAAVNAKQREWCGHAGHASGRLSGRYRAHARPRARMGQEHGCSGTNAAARCCSCGAPEFLQGTDPTRRAGRAEGRRRGDCADTRKGIPSPPHRSILGATTRTPPRLCALFAWRRPKRPPDHDAVEDSGTARAARGGRRGTSTQYADSIAAGHQQRHL